jgi:hypothetical protein
VMMELAGSEENPIEAVQDQESENR